MRVPLTLVAALIAGSAAAQPAKHEAPKPAPAGEKRVEVVLASADAVHPQAPAVPDTAAQKRPAPRITHCRCGDPLPEAQAPEE